MDLGWVIFVVPDVAATIDFFERAFGLSRRFVGDAGDYGEMDTGATTLAFVAESLAATTIPVGLRPNRPGEAPAGAQVTLVTDNVGDAYDRAVAAGAVGLGAPTTTPWGQTVAYLRDPNGLLVEIGTPIGES